MSTVVSTQIGLLEKQESQNSRRLWLQWLSVTIVGYLWAAAIATQLYPMAGYVRTAILGPYFSTVETGNQYGLLPQVAMGAIVIALFQWRVLQHYMPDESWRQWVGANVLGYVGGLVGSMSLLSILSPGLRVYSGAAQVNLRSLGVALLIVAGVGATLGTLAALPQSRVLRAHLRDADLWIWANAGAWAVTGIVLLLIQIGSVLLTYQLATQPQRVLIDGNLLNLALGLISGLAMGIIVGAITGAVLVRLLRQHPRMDTNAHE